METPASSAAWILVSRSGSVFMNPRVWQGLTSPTVGCLLKTSKAVGASEEGVIVDIDTRVWNYSNTGTKLHAFLNGVAICRSSIRRPGAEHTALDYCEARSHQMCAT